MHLVWVADCSSAKETHVRSITRHPLSPAHTSTAQEASTHDVVPSDAYILHRIMHGVPEGSADIQPMHAFPIESNLDVMGGRAWPLSRFHIDADTRLVLQSTFARGVMWDKSSLYGPITPASYANEFSPSPCPRRQRRRVHHYTLLLNLR